ncbi:unnamed protein product, partial [marine sediment metagenome]
TKKCLSPPALKRHDIFSVEKFSIKVSDDSL